MVRLLGVARASSPALKVGRTAKSTVDTYWLSISGADQIEEALWLLEPHERAEVADVDSAGSRSGSLRPATGATARARRGFGSSTSTDRRDELAVYSAEVERNHTIVTSFGLVAHNCFPKDTRALLKIADDAGYEFDLLDGVVAVNDEQFDRVAEKIARRRRRRASPARPSPCGA